ncbi:rhomboid family intramembrane serine protease [Maritimibacter fusiformis]|uniref:Rhomboid family intramembrane serine protease n=1 Tax=Maritimibacter fusiformis TaxID=2603819 RepID=A0A5D0RKU4_9RHOB|nr:rhomboid family intramembrane serine protease [Maritimibacter fusiformis]TYB82247.1 rhomboid family intramembrane serine protease [Maritimibacter fusiformis]
MRPPFELPTDQDHNAPPVNPLPPAVVVLALAIFGIELVLTAANAGILGGPAGTGWRLAAMERFGFYEPMFDWMIQNGTIRWEFMARFVTYPFIHGTFTHALFVLVFLLALGKLVGEVLSNWAVLVVFFGASVLGALVYGLVWDTRVVLFGGFPGAYGMVGAYTFILWAGLAGRATGLQAFTLIAFLLGIQLVFGLLFGGGLNWVAEIAGFASGFGLAFLVSPGGWAAIVGKIRRR